MPRITFLAPPEVTQLADDLRKKYGGMMTARDVGREIGVTHADSYVKYLKDVPAVIVNNRKRYRVMDVAKKIYDSIA